MAFEHSLVDRPIDSNLNDPAEQFACKSHDYKLNIM